MKITKSILILTAILVTSFILKADASVVYFAVNWSGASHGNSATATAWVGIDTAIIENPGPDGGVNIPSWFDSITLTISGASSGNGTFTKNDFEAVLWDTRGGTLDFDSELVGQTTISDPWGTTHDGDSGDFNLFRATGSPLAPTGTSNFQLTPSGSSEGDSDTMNLISFAPVIAGDAELTIYQSIELVFPTRTNAIYQIQISTNLAEWINFETPFLGNGKTNSVHFSTRNKSKQFYRVKEGTPPATP